MKMLYMYLDIKYVKLKHKYDIISSIPLFVGVALYFILYFYVLLWLGSRI
jgi:hypothetical protein